MILPPSPAVAPETASAPVTTPETASSPGDTSTANVSGPVTDTSTPSQPPVESKPTAADYMKTFSSASLRRIVDDCPKECLTLIYRAGEELRNLVNQRWQIGN